MVRVLVRGFQHDMKGRISGNLRFKSHQESNNILTLLHFTVSSGGFYRFRLHELTDSDNTNAVDETNALVT
jgi:hypothetical protein